MLVCTIYICQICGKIKSTEDDNKLLEQLKTIFKRTIKWNKN